MAVELFQRPVNYIDVIEHALGIQLSPQFLKYNQSKEITDPAKLYVLAKRLSEYHASPVIEPEQVPVSIFLEFKITASDSNIDYLKARGELGKLAAIFKEPLVFFEQVLFSDPIHSLFVDFGFPEDGIQRGDLMPNRLLALLDFLAILAPYLRSGLLLPVGVPVSQYRSQDGGYANISSSLYLSQDWEDIAAGRRSIGSLTGNAEFDLFAALRRGGYSNGGLDGAALYGDARDNLWSRVDAIFRQFDETLPLLPKAVWQFLGGAPGYDPAITNYSDLLIRYRDARTVFDIKDRFEPRSRIYEDIWRVIGQSAYQEQILRRQFSQSALLWHDAFNIGDSVASAADWETDDQTDRRHPASALQIYEAYLQGLSRTGNGNDAGTFCRFSSGFGIRTEHLTFEDMIGIRENEELFSAYRAQVREGIAYARDFGHDEDPRVIKRQFADLEKSFAGLFESRIGKTDFIPAIVDRSKDCCLAILATSVMPQLIPASFMEALFTTVGVTAATVATETAAVKNRRDVKRRYTKHWASIQKKRRAAE